MNFYIKELADGTAALITGSGSVIWTFHSLSDAQEACSDTQRVHIEYNCVDDCYLQDPGCSSCAVA